MIAESGYGHLDDIEKWDARKVLQTIYRIEFLDNYSAAYLKIQAEEGGK